MFQQFYILFLFCPDDLVIVATVPLVFEVDIWTIYWQYLCFLNLNPQKYMFTKSLPVTIT